MRVAGGENAVRMRMARILSDGEDQFRDRFIEAPAEEVRGADDTERRADLGARTEAQRSLCMLNCDIELGRVRSVSEIAADLPASRETGVEPQGAVDQRQHGADVLAEEGERNRGVHQHSRVIAGYLQRAPRKVSAL